MLFRRAALIGVLVAVPVTLAVVTGQVGATSSNISSSPAETAPVAVNLALPAPSNPQESATPSKVTEQADLAALAEVPAPALSGDVEVIEVRNGDTLAGILGRFGIGAATVHELTSASSTAASLARIHPGQLLHVRLSDSGDLVEIVHQTSAMTGIRAWAADDGFRAEAYEEPVESRVAYASGTIDGSLYAAASLAGLSDRVIMQLADIFGWDVDFALDIRSGDSFLVIYEERYLNGEKLDDGDVLAAEFSNQGHRYQALRFVDDDGNRAYLTPDGHSLRKAFLRTPVNFSRISSHFSLGRKHPILHKLRAHKGVDYAAPTGTPVKASGDGKVAFVGTKGGYGKTVVLQHGQGYSTLYAHLSRFTKGLRAGIRVHQGEVIGFVGSSGLATGPHLHYEFQVNGTHMNPLTVRLPQAAPIEQRYRAAFSQLAGERLAQLETIRRTQLASSN